jgi:hypothetical protein
MQLIPVLKDVQRNGRADDLLHSLDQVSAQKEREIEKICSKNHQEFVGSVQQLLTVRDGTVQLTSQILQLNQSIQESTEQLAQEKKALVDSRSVRQNIDEATEGLDACLEVLRVANQVHELLGRKRHYAALKALDELRNVHLKDISRYKLADTIQKSVPATQKMIADAVMKDLNTWLYRIREASQYLGEVAFYHTEMRRERLKQRIEQDPQLQKFKLNSSLELVSDEMDEFDILNNEEIETQFDFTPLYECMHIHATLGRLEHFKTEYAATRRRQKELLIPTSLQLQDEEEALSSLLESIAGFAIVERATINKTDNFRASVDVDELWDSMCQSAIALISSALINVNNDEKLLRIKGRISLFIQTMDSWGYPTSTLHSLVLNIFEKYAQILKHRFSTDFEEVVATDDYMPMAINSLQEYNQVVDVSWYIPDKDPNQLKFPCVLPFSQMYPLCCIDIRNFLNQIYLFSDDQFQHSALIDETLQKSLDELLCEKVCQSLVNKLNSQYLGQIVQIMTNFEHFETACTELQTLLFDARSSTTMSGPVLLHALEKLRAGKKDAEKRIFELVNSKIDDLISTAEYDWLASTVHGEPSLYMQELTRYLSVNMNSVLLGLPADIKELIYFDALSHAATEILALPLDGTVTKITPSAAKILDQDVVHLSEFVESIGNPILKKNLDQMLQTVALMNTSDPDEFFDVALANKKYGMVDRANGAILLEKYVVYQSRFKVC